MTVRRTIKSLPGNVTQITHSWSTPGYGESSSDVYRHEPTGNTWLHAPLHEKQFGGVLYHSSMHNFSPGEHVIPLTEQGPGASPANPFVNEDERDYNTTFATGSPDAARRWPGNVYKVRPLGPVFPDHTGVASDDYQVPGHLEVLGKLD